MSLFSFLKFSFLFLFFFFSFLFSFLFFPFSFLVFEFLVFVLVCEWICPPLFWSSRFAPSSFFLYFLSPLFFPFFFPYPFFLSLLLFPSFFPFSFLFFLFQSPKALETLYEATAGGHWKEKDGWKSGDPCLDSWFNVTCDDQTWSR